MSIINDMNNFFIKFYTPFFSKNQQLVTQSMDLLKNNRFFKRTAKSADFDSGAMVYTASWWDDKSPLNVRVFSNCDEVELFLNGKSLGRQKPDQDIFCTKLNHPPFTFKLQHFEAGILQAKAYLGG